MSKVKDAVVAEVPAKVVKSKKAKVVKAVGKRGRPVDTASERQKRLARFEEMRASGVVVQRGRPKLNKPVVVKVKKVKPVVVKTKTVKTKPEVVVPEMVTAE